MRSTEATSLSILMHADTDASVDGGVNRGMLTLGSELATLGLHVDYLFGTDRRGRFAGYLDRLPRPIRLYDPGIGAVLLARKLEQSGAQYDIIYSHGSNAIFDAVIATRLLGRHATYLLLANLHGCDHGVLNSLRTELRRGREPHGWRQIAVLAHFSLAVLKEHFAYRRVPGLVAISPRVAAEARRWFSVNPTPICLSTDSQQFSPELHRGRRAAVRRRLGLGVGDIAVLAIGKPAYRKGTRYLVEAVNHIGPPFRLVLVGAERRIGAPHAIELRSMPHEKLPDLYAACDIFCLPSTYEAFGRVLLDGMASGLACVSADHFGGQLLIEDGVNGLLTPRRSVSALVAALDRLREPLVRHHLGAEARATAGRFSLRREAEDTLSWFHDQLKSHGRQENAPTEDGSLHFEDVGRGARE